jgi:hypothetical protein
MMTEMDRPERDAPPPVGGSSPPGDPAFVVAGRDEFDVRGRGGPTAEVLQRAIDLMTRTGPDADAAYQDALTEVRSQPPEGIAQMVAEVLREVPEENYLDRWSLVQVLSEVSPPGSEWVLRDVLSATLPPERSSEADYKSSTRGREVIIRTTAVEGLARLARQGSAEAVDVIVANLGHEDKTVRVACIVALNELGGDAEERGRAGILDEDRDLAPLRRTSVHDVPQFPGGDYVKNPETDDTPPPTPPAKSNS